MMEKYIRGLKIQKVTCTVQLSLFLSCDLFEDDNFLLVVFFSVCGGLIPVFLWGMGSQMVACRSCCYTQACVCFRLLLYRSSPLARA